MGKQDEYEYKLLLTEAEYNTVCRWAEENYYAVMHRFVQLNYYYDTPSFSFRGRGITIRVRQHGAGLKGTVKTHGVDGDLRHSREQEFAVRTLPGSIVQGTETALLQGVLITERTEIPLRKHFTLMLDRSSYLGRVDYELELEFPRGSRKQAAQFIEELLRAIRGGPCCSKSERFFQALEEHR